MLTKAKLILSNREIVLKILFTFALLLVFKAGTYIPIPFISTTSVRQILSGNDQGESNSSGNSSEIPEEPGERE